MFRCDHCGSGYSAQAASSWQFCPRCLAREKLNVPLVFELGWQRPGGEAPRGRAAFGQSGAPARQRSANAP
jgi:hypothetical protein